MTIARPTTLQGAVDAVAVSPEADLLSGGTDFMVEVNFGHRRPRDIVALRRVDELRALRREDGHWSLGAGLTYRAMEHELAATIPALAQAARTVGSPQIRSAGTLGGNVATASPAGDTLPVLAAMDAEVDLISASGPRRLALSDFITGVKKTDLRPGELIQSVQLRHLDGPQEFCKVGTRNAMVISVSCLALIMDIEGQTVRCGLGAVSPVPLRATRAEEFISEAMDWSSMTVGEADIERFADLVAESCSPIDDHRGTAAYRRHAVGVMARRALHRCVTQ